ncbi:MAG: ribbon-helix-helix protein, CopG family [Acidimicrobiia bacterium]
MRTTVTLDPDSVAIVEAERARTGASFKEAINDLLRRSAGGAGGPSNNFPLRPGRPRIDIADVAALLSGLDEERRAERNLP